MQVKKEEVRAIILHHALDEFEKNSYSHAKIRNIAKNSKISIGNIYRYFESKDDLYQAVVEPVYTRLSALVFDLYRHQDPEEVNITTIARQVSAGIMEVYAKHGRSLMILVDKNMGSTHENFLQTLIDMVNERLKKELVLPDDPAEVLSHVVAWGFVNGLFTVLRKYQHSVTAETAIQRLILFYFDDIQHRLEKNV